MILLKLSENNCMLVSERTAFPMSESLMKLHLLVYSELGNLSENSVEKYLLWMWIWSIYLSPLTMPIVKATVTVWESFIFFSLISANTTQLVSCVKKNEKGKRKSCFPIVSHPVTPLHKYCFICVIVLTKRSWFPIWFFSHCIIRKLTCFLLFLCQHTSQSYFNYIG